MSEELDIRYVAGIVDGEGCIRFNRLRKTVVPAIFVTNTNLELLDALKAQFGGSIYSLSKQEENWKRAYSWRLTWGNAIRLVRAIHPYLIVKRRQADTLLAWDRIRPGKGIPWDRSDGSIDLLVSRIAWLNKRGPVEGRDPIEDVLDECGYYLLSDQDKAIASAEAEAWLN